MPMYMGDGCPKVKLGREVCRMYQSCGFEVHGKVQKVYFRKHTQEEAIKLGLVGWVMNTENGTVIGEMQGAKEAVESMKTWLRTTGSPQSKIEQADFEDDCEIESLTFTEFDIKR